MPFVVRIVFAEGSGEIPLLLQYLQVQHDDREKRKRRRQRVEVQKQNADVHKIKAEKRRVAAEAVYAGRNKLRFVRIRDPRPPAVLHTDNGEQKDEIAEQSRTEAGKACSGRQHAPPERNG